MTDQERRAMIRDFVYALANFWIRWGRPVRFDEAFRMGLVRVHIVIEEATSKDDTKPLSVESLYPDRSIDA